jgi:hypothetical protein
VPTLPPFGRLVRRSSALLAGVMGLYALLEALGPRGFSFRDETFCFHQALSYRAGYPWAWTWANGNLLKLLQFQLYAWTGRWQVLHLPALLALGAQAGAVYAIGKRLGGPRVAQGALLASLLSATALLQARSLLPFATLPCLLALSAALALQGPRWACLGGLVCACGFLEYEATAFALPGLAALLFFEPTLERRSAWAFAMGAGLGLGLVAWLCRDSLLEWWSYRLAYNHPWAATAGNPVAQRLGAWFLGGEPQAYLGIRDHGVLAAWALPLGLLGLGLQARRRPWLLLWVAGALAALLPASSKFEPQRAFPALIPLGLAAGFAWRALWCATPRRPWLAYALLALPLLGAAYEVSAFERSMRAGEAEYQRSQAWQRLAQDPAVAGHVDAALLPVGLTFECLNGPPRPGTPAPWVWMPSDLDHDAPHWPGQAVSYPDGRPTGDLLMQVPAGDPLRQDLEVLRPLWLQISGLRGRREPAIAACRQALAGGRLHSHLGRCAVWDFLMDACIKSDSLRVADLQALDREGIHSAFFYRARLIYSRPKDQRLSYWLCSLLRKHAGADKLQDDERQLLAQDWDQLPPAPGAPAWPKPGPT